MYIYMWYIYMYVCMYVSMCDIYIYICDLFIHAYRYTHTYVVVYKYKIYICIHIQKGTITISGGGGDHQTLGHICAYLFIQSCVYTSFYIWSGALQTANRRGLHWATSHCSKPTKLLWYLARILLRSTARQIYDKSGIENCGPQAEHFFKSCVA
jgi:hypothetical protein